MAREILVRSKLSPWPHQCDAHARRKRNSVLVWHRRAGKTVYAVNEVVEGAIACRKTRPRFAYIAPFLKQAKVVAWDYLRHLTEAWPAEAGRSVNESELSIRLGTGATIRIYGADNPDALRGGYFDGVVLDEVADMRPQVWGEIVRPALADRAGWSLFIGTPKGINLFSEVYFGALKDPENWHADLKNVYDTRVIPAEEVEKLRREMSEQAFAQEFLCDFHAAVSNTLVTMTEALAAAERKPDEQQYAFAPRVLGVDCARYGDDRTVILMRQGIRVFEPLVLRHLDTMQVASAVAEAIDKLSPRAVFVDQGGLGAGVVDRLRQLGHRVVGVDFGSRPIDIGNENKRAEMWRAMAEWIKSGGCIPDDKSLLSDLCAPTYDYANARGKFQLESKDDMRKRGLPSPDIADALALTFAAHVAAPAPETFIPGHQSGSSDYNPLWGDS